MADLCVGDRCASALDLSYFNYAEWCTRLGYNAAPYSEWLCFERGVSRHSMVGLSSYSDSRSRLARMRAAQAARATA